MQSLGKLLEEDISGCGKTMVRLVVGPEGKKEEGNVEGAVLTSSRTTKTFSVPMNVLVSNSPVFAAMLTRTCVLVNKRE